LRSGGDDRTRAFVLSFVFFSAWARFPIPYRDDWTGSGPPAAPEQVEQIPPFTRHPETEEAGGHHAVEEVVEVAEQDEDERREEAGPLEIENCRYHPPHVPVGLKSVIGVGKEMGRETLKQVRRQRKESERVQQERSELLHRFWP